MYVLHIARRGEENRVYASLPQVVPTRASALGLCFLLPHTKHRPSALARVGTMPQAIQIEKGSLVVKTVAVFSILL